MHKSKMFIQAIFSIWAFQSEIKSTLLAMGFRTTNYY
jgi:hypothetical protein